MNDEEFCEFGKAAIDYLIDYYKKVRNLPVLPSVEPGYLSKLLPSEAPEKSESWTNIMEDIDRCIMQGVSCIMV